MVDTFRVTTYEFEGTTVGAGNYTLILNNDLSENYFCLVAGAQSGTASRGADDDGLRVSGDPHGNFGTTTNANELRLTRGGDGNWIGAVTVVECLGDEGAGGFELLEVLEVSLPAGSAGANPQTVDTALANNFDANRDVPFAGTRGQGGGVEVPGTGDSNNDYAATLALRALFTGTNNLRLERNGLEASRTPRAATATVFHVRWGTEWTVRAVDVTNWGEGAGGAASAAAYASRSIGVTIDGTKAWLLHTGWGRSDGLGDGPFGTLAKIGAGGSGAPGTTESLVAVGSEYSEVTNTRSSTLYVMEHADLAVDWRFKADGDVGASSGYQEGTQTIDAAGGTETYDNTSTTVRYTEGHRWIQFSNGCNGTGQAYSRPHFAWRITGSTTATWWRSYSGQNWPAWFQAVDTSGIQHSSGTVYEDLAGTAAGAATITADASRLRDVDGTAAAAASASGSLERVTELAGSSSGTASPAATTSRLRALGSAAAGSAAVTASLVHADDLAATSSGAASVSGDVSRVRGVGADSTGAASSTSTLSSSATDDLAGSSAGLASASVGASVVRGLGGAPAGAASVSGEASRVRDVESEATGSATSTATLSSAATEDLAGAAAGAATTAGDLSGARSLTATSPATASGSATLSASGVQDLAGTSTASSTSAGGASRARGLVGAPAGAASSSATLGSSGVQDLAGTSPGSAAASGNVSRRRDIDGAVAGSASVAGSLSSSGAQEMAGAANGASAGFAALSLSRTVAGDAQGAGAASGAVARIRDINGAAAGGAGVDATLAHADSLSGAAGGVAIASGDATRIRGVSTDADGAASVLATLSSFGTYKELSTLAPGTSLIVATIDVLEPFVETTSRILSGPTGPRAACPSPPEGAANVSVPRRGVGHSSGGKGVSVG